MHSDVPVVNSLSDFSIEQIEAMCKEFFVVRFKSVIIDILKAADVTRYYSVNCE